VSKLLKRLVRLVIAALLLLGGLALLFFPSPRRAA